MSFIITSISTIDPSALEFDGTDGETVHPTAAFEILGTLSDKKVETYGVVWDIEGQCAGFLSEELDEFLTESHPDLYTDKISLDVSSFIYKKFIGEDVNLPFVVWST
ncbi:MAG: hypothetical protein ACRBB3_00845 [Alphaproteobacteria bacterium]